MDHMVYVSHDREYLMAEKIDYMEGSHTKGNYMVERFIW